MGEHLKKQRLDLGLFQRGVAGRLHVSESAYLRWENDKARPAARLLPRPIDFLGYDPYRAGHSFSTLNRSRQTQRAATHPKFITDAAAMAMNVSHMPAVR